MKKIVPAVAALALVAMPVAGAQAKPGGNGHGGPERAERHSGERPGAQDRAGKRDAAERRANSRRCKREVRRGFVVRGSLAGYDAESVTLDVQRANKHARRWLRDNAPTFDTSDARFSFEGVTDSTGEGTVDLADVTDADRVRVIGKLSTPKRGCEGEQSLTIRKVVVTRETEDESDE